MIARRTMGLALALLVAAPPLMAQGGTPQHPDRRWSAFGTLLSTPMLPSELARR